MTESKWVSCKINVKHFVQMCAVKKEFNKGNWNSHPRGFFSSVLSHRDLDELEPLQRSVYKDGRGWVSTAHGAVTQSNSSNTHFKGVTHESEILTLLTSYFVKQFVDVSLYAG